MSGKDFGNLLVVIIVVVFAIVIAAMGGCETSTDEVTRTLESAGYSNITPGDASWSCGHGDKWLGRTFRATNPAGSSVSGTVCCGFWLKGCTVRF